MWKHYGAIYLMILPGVLYFVIFKYLPMGGIVIAFKQYQPFAGFFASPWVGLDQFERFFSSDDFWMLFRNTMLISLYKLVFFFPIPIILSLILNELHMEWFKRIIQSLIYVPHFFSWLVIVGIFYVLLTTQNGIVNHLIQGLVGHPVNFLGSEHWIRPLLTVQTIWHEAGWGTILYLAAITGVNPALYESACMDGAGKLRQMWHITLPGIRSTIVLLFILQLGHFLDLGFEQIYNMLNPTNTSAGDVFDTYVYRVGIQQGNFSYSTAVGLFKSLVGLILVLSSNWVVRKSGEEGVF